jgi:hypothetical protein
VELTITVTVDVAPGSDVATVEQQVVEAGRTAMRRALARMGRVLEPAQVVCPRCAATTVAGCGTVRRTLLTSVGQVRVPLRRLRCRACRTRFRPAAPAFAALAGRQVTPALARLCAEAAMTWPFAQAASVVQRLCGARVSAETVRQVVRTAGSAEAQAQHAAAEHVLAPTMAQVRAERDQQVRGQTPEPPAFLLVGMDGGWVPSWDTKDGMEGKVGVVATEAQVISASGRRRLVQRRYVATFADADTLGTLVGAAACALGGEHAPRQTVVGDGAGWIKTQAQAQFPDATTILDWPHLARAVHKAIRAARPGAGNREVRRTAHQALPALLWDGEVDAAISALTALPEAGTEPAAAFAETLGYLDGQRGWIGNYGAWRAAGEPIGSGLIERAVALVINWRMKRRGMRWRRATATAIVALRVRCINDTWHARYVSPAA